MSLAYKMMPLSEELATAITLDNQHEAGLPQQAIIPQSQQIVDFDIEDKSIRDINEEKEVKNEQTK